MRGAARTKIRLEGRTRCVFRELCRCNAITLHANKRIACNADDQENSILRNYR